MKQGGFTLVELMVSLAIFSIVITISIGTLLVMIDVNAKAQALYSSTTNLSFALDSIAREVRTSYAYNCQTTFENDGIPNQGATQNCSTGGGQLLAFIRESDNEQSGYRKSGSSLERYQDGSWIPITSEQDVIIEVFDVTVQHAGVGDGEQPTVDIFIQGKVNNGLDVDTDFSIQTHIVSRQLDI